MISKKENSIVVELGHGDVVFQARVLNNTPTLTLVPIKKSVPVGTSYNHLTEHDENVEAGRVQIEIPTYEVLQVIRNQLDAIERLMCETIA